MIKWVRMVGYLIYLILVLIGVVTVWVEFNEVVSDVKSLNLGGDKGTALVLYQKGLRDFQPKVARAQAAP